MNFIPKNVIGVSGHMGSGKGTVVEMLELIFGNRVIPARTTKIIEDALRQRGVPSPNEVKAKQKGFEEIAAEEGNDWLHGRAHRLWHDAHLRHPAPMHPQLLCIYDSVRTEQDTRWILGFPNALLIHTHADARTRFERVRRRAERREFGAKDDERDISFEEFLRRHEHSTAIFIDSILRIPRAIVLENNTTVRSLGAQLIAVLMTKGLVSFTELEEKKQQLESLYRNFEQNR